MVLVAVGRRPVTDGSTSQPRGSKTNDKGFIDVDAQRKTPVDGIYAIGDITGGPLLAHKAMKEGVVAAEVIAGDKRLGLRSGRDSELRLHRSRSRDRRPLRRGSQSCGLHDQDRQVPADRLGPRAHDERNRRLDQAGRRREDRALSGMHIVAPQAESLIGEGVIALEMGATVEDIGLSIHPHPTLTESIMDAAEAMHGKAIHIPNPKPAKATRRRLSATTWRSSGFWISGGGRTARCGRCSGSYTPPSPRGGEPDTWIVVEHDPVITLGRNAKPENLLALARRAGRARRRRRRGRARRRRHLSRPGPSRRLSDSRVAALSRSRAVRVGARTRRYRGARRLRHRRSRPQEHRGVYVGDDAIGAIGLAVQKMTSLHGLALNAATALDYDRLITPCGTPRIRDHLDLRASSARTVSWTEARDALLPALEAEFGVRFERDVRNCRRPRGVENEEPWKRSI